MYVYEHEKAIVKCYNVLNREGDDGEDDGGGDDGGERWMWNRVGVKGNKGGKGGEQYEER